MIVKPVRASSNWIAVIGDREIYQAAALVMVAPRASTAAPIETSPATVNLLPAAQQIEFTCEVTCRTLFVIVVGGLREHWRLCLARGGNC